MGAGGRWCMGRFSRGFRSLMPDLLGICLNANRIRRECQVFCVTDIRSMLSRKGSMHDNFQGSTG
jgi:hypothetical protein